MLRKIALVIAGLGCACTVLLSQPTIQISNATANQGETVTISLTADNYTDYISLEFVLNWDPNVLQYSGVSNLTAGLPGFTEASSIFIPQNGMLNVSWFESNITPTTLPNGTVLFQVSFEVTGDPCDESPLTLTGIEIADASETNVGATVVSGLVNVPGTNCGMFNGVRIIGEQKTVSSGQPVCIKFTTEGFNNVVAGSYTVTFNPAVIQYTGIQNINWPGLVNGSTYNDTQAGSGILHVVWFDQDVQGIDIADGTVLYELCFQAVGSGGQMSQIGFGNSPVMIEFADGNSQPLEFEGVPGKVTIEGQLDGFALIMPDVAAGIGEEICLPVTVNDFNDILAMQGSINWDSTILEFVRFQNFNLAGLQNGVSGPEVPGNNAGQAVFLWFDDNIQGVTLPNGTAIMEICFKVIGACTQSSSVSFTGVPTPIEFADLNDEITDYTLVDGSVTVDCGGGCGITAFDVNHICPGGECGGVDITLAPGCTNPTFLWSNGATTEDLACVGPGKYVVTITVGSQTIISDSFNVRQLDPIQVSANVTDSPGGNDGAISIMVSGGLPGYTYLWSNGATSQNISNLAPGNFSVTITDANGCVFVAGPYSVGDGNAVSAIVTNACSGGASGCIEITSVSCVDPPLSYQWSGSSETGATLCNIPAGTYTVTVTGNGGSTCTQSFNILEAASPIIVQVDTMNETSAGNDGEIHLTVTGGQAPYNYVWSPALPGNPDQTGLSSGLYTVTVSDQLGCAVVEEIVVRGNELFVDIVGSSYNGYGVSCAGECDGELLALPGNAVGSVSYAWSNGAPTAPVITDVCPGSYVVTVTDQTGATATASYTVTGPPTLLAQVETDCSSEPGALDGSAIAAVNGGIEPYQYAWSNGSTNSSIHNITSGPYQLSVTDDNGCESIRRFDISICGIDCYQAISVITPNDDGKNDLFTINCVYQYPNTLSVFNRYGGLEFEMDDYDNSWDGRDQDDNVLSDGAYHWVLIVTLPTGEQQVHHGTVSVVRSLN